MHHARGFDSIPYNQELLLSLQFREGTGTQTFDYAKPHHPTTVAGIPVWSNTDTGLSVLVFDGNDDQVTVTGANSMDLDFTTENFTCAVWAYHDDQSSAHVIMNRGTLDTNGWEWYTAVNNLALRTNQAGSREGASGMGFIAVDTWQFLVTVRDGLIGRAYCNGEARYTLQSANGLLDPASAGAHTFYVGNNPHTNWYDGMMWNPRLWPRALSAGEIEQMFETERYMFGV